VLSAVNAAGHESGNTAATEGRDLPLLQDTLEVDAWGLWAVTWRDVVILDRENVPVAIYNLTDHNLGQSPEYEGLKSLLIQVHDMP
jgi:hypothetical protein